MYGILAALFTLVYVALVIGVGTVVGDRGNSFLTILTAVAIAVAFQPVRERVRHLANRIVYGKRATPYEVLSEFSDKVATSFAAEDVLPRMAQILASGTGASSARVWLRFGEELRPAASWPENGSVPPVAVEDGAPRRVRRGGGRRRGPPPRRAPRRALGDDAAERPDEPVEGAARPRPRGAGRARAPQRPADRGAPRLAPPDRHGAGRARQAARTQPARRRAAAARRARRAARASRAGSPNATPPRWPRRSTQLQQAATDALENLRDLARGIYPPLLADQGLVVALEAQARKAALPVEVEGEGIGRYPQEVEAAVYFCCLEALQNVAKYANASSAHVRLADRDGTVTFEVTDDGTGFDPEHTPLGTGLQGMRDRLEALGGDARGRLVTRRRDDGDGIDPRPWPGSGLRIGPRVASGDVEGRTPGRGSVQMRSPLLSSAGWRNANDKTELGSGRVEAFSDAVFAVIITIMALELRAPQGHSLADVRDDLLPGLIVYALSFTLIGIYWNNHHHLLRAANGSMAP